MYDSTPKRHTSAIPDASVRGQQDDLDRKLTPCDSKCNNPTYKEPVPTGPLSKIFVRLRGSLFQGQQWSSPVHSLRQPLSSQTPGHHQCTKQDVPEMAWPTGLLPLLISSMDVSQYMGSTTNECGELDDMQQRTSHLATRTAY
jgi:hypothetical protein